jgi:plastocyanin
MVGMQTAERIGTQTSGAAGPAGLGWRELLVWLAIGLPVALLVGMVMLGELIPPLVIFAVLFLVGAFLARRGGRAGPIMLAILSAAMIALNAPFIVEAIEVPASTADFLLATASTTLALGVLIAAIGTMRRSAAMSRAPRTIAISVLILLVALTGVGVAARVTYDQPVAASGDITLVTQDMEFAPETITADSGEITVFVENADNTLHTFTIEALGVDLQIPGKENGTITFEADAGAYEFVCRPHESMGMKGTLEVE